MGARQNKLIALVGMVAFCAYVVTAHEVRAGRNVSEVANVEERPVSRFLVETSPSDGSIVSVALCVPLDSTVVPSVNVLYVRKEVDLLQVPIVNINAENGWALQSVLIGASSFRDDGEIVFNVIFGRHDDSPLRTEIFLVSKLIDEFRQKGLLTQGATCEASKVAETGKINKRDLNMKL